MIIIANLIRVGNIIKFQNRSCRVMNRSHIKPGKGGAFVQIEMKDIESGTKFDERFRSDDKVERVSLEEVEMLFLYEDGDFYYIMDQKTYEQIEFPATDIDETIKKFLVEENMKVLVQLVNDKPISVNLQKHVVATIAETEGVVKGQTATASFKPATLENGVNIMVPQFIKVDDRIIINTETMEYSEREKASK